MNFGFQASSVDNSFWNKVCAYNLVCVCDLNLIWKLFVIPLKIKSNLVCSKSLTYQNKEEQQVCIKYHHFITGKNYDTSHIAIVQ